MPVATDKALDGSGRYPGPATLILASLADGAKHGYALTKDIESFAGVRVAPGTLYEALARLQGQGLIEPVESQDRRRPYRLTAVGATTLQAQLDAQRRVADVGLRRLAPGWSPACGAGRERGAGASSAPAPLLPEGLAGPLRRGVHRAAGRRPRGAAEVTGAHGGRDP